MKIETEMLKRLGPVPFWRGEKKCLDALETMYRKAVVRAQAALRAAEGRSDGKGGKPARAGEARGVIARTGR